MHGDLSVVRLPLSVVVALSTLGGCTASQPPVGGYYTYEEMCRLNDGVMYCEVRGDRRCTCISRQESQRILRELQRAMNY